MTSITHADRSTRAERAGRSARVVFVGVTLLVFAVAAVATAAMSRSMSAMRGMPMTGDGTLSMTWMPMGGQTWIRATGDFVAMWTVMMVAMMLPSVAPELWRYRQRVARSGAPHAGLRCASAGVGYLSVWVTLGVAIFPLGALVTRWLTRTPAAARAVPLVVSAVLLIAGATQFTRWKASRLAACGRPLHTTEASPLVPSAGLRHGVRLGIDCCTSCVNWMAILLVMGVMAPAAMVAITAAVTAERLAPGSVSVRRVTGAAAIAVGVILVIRERFAL